MGTKESFVVKLGPLMKKLLDKQVESVKKATYNTCDVSYWDAGEILAKKLNEG